MKRMSFFLSIIVAVMMITMTGCHSDDENNPEFTEYTNPMANNPVNTIDWLKAAKDQAKQRFVIEPGSKGVPFYKQDGQLDITWGAYIKSYTYQEQDYYEVRYGGLNVKGGLKFGILNFQCYIYDSQGNLCYSITGGDAGGPRPGYEHFQNFWDVATFKSLLWEYKTTN